MNHDGSLRKRTESLLKGDPRPLVAIARDASIGLSWLEKFNRKVILNPGVDTVQKLHDHLDAKRLTNEQ